MELFLFLHFFCNFFSFLKTGWTLFSVRFQLVLRYLIHLSPYAVSSGEHKTFLFFVLCTVSHRPLGSRCSFQRSVSSWRMQLLHHFVSGLFSQQCLPCSQLTFTSLTWHGYKSISFFLWLVELYIIASATVWFHLGQCMNRCHSPCWW